MPSEIRRLKQLEEENQRLMRLVAASEPEEGNGAGGRPKNALRPARQREPVDDLRWTWQVSARRACAVLRRTGRATTTGPAARRRPS